VSSGWSRMGESRRSCGGGVSPGRRLVTGDPARALQLRPGESCDAAGGARSSMGARSIRDRPRLRVCGHGTGRGAAKSGSNRPHEGDSAASLARIPSTRSQTPTVNTIEANTEPVASATGPLVEAKVAREWTQQATFMNSNPRGLTRLCHPRGTLRLSAWKRPAIRCCRLARGFASPDQATETAASILRVG
jgi:hypothetical protein